MMEMTLRGNNYATEIVTIYTIINRIESLKLGDRYYFTVNMEGAALVLYVELRKEEIYEVARLCKDNTVYVNPTGKEDELIKVAATTRAVKYDDELVIQDSSPTKGLARYVLNYVDAIQTVRY